MINNIRKDRDGSGHLETGIAISSFVLSIIELRSYVFRGKISCGIPVVL